MLSRGFCVGVWILSSLVGAHDVAGRVLGFRTAETGVTMAVRGIVLEGTVVTGIQFYSNDAITYSEVFLATDSGDEDLLQPGTVLRSVENVSGVPGYVTVAFPPYEVRQSQFLWAVVRFPDGQRLRAEGVGGGPGMGLRSTTGGLLRERSVYTAGGGFGELGSYGQFDLTILSAGGPAAKPGAPESTESRAVVTVWTNWTPGSGATFAITLPAASHVRLELFDVAGRRIRQLGNSWLAPGRHEIRWDGRDAAGRRVASGIYTYTLRIGAEDRRSGKVVLID